MLSSIITRVCKRIPANSLWDRYVLAKKVEAAAATLQAHNQKNTNDQIHSQDPHSA